MNKYRYTFKTLSHWGHCINLRSRYCAVETLKDTEPNYQSFISCGLLWRGKHKQHPESNIVVLLIISLYVSIFCVADIKRHSQQAVYWEMFKGKPPVGLCVILH